MNSTTHVNISAWTLDCSPECRSDPNILCESDDFLLNPHNFFYKTYDLNEAHAKVYPDNHSTYGDDNSNEMVFCEISQSNRSEYSTKKLIQYHQKIPDVIVVDDNALGSLSKELQAIGFGEIVFRQAVLSLRIVHKKSKLAQATEANTIVCFGTFCLGIFFESIHVFSKHKKKLLCQ